MEELRRVKKNSEPDSEVPAEHALDKDDVLDPPDAEHAPHPKDRPKDDFDEPDDLGVDVI